MCRIIPFPTTPEAKNRLIARGGSDEEQKRIEAALQREGHILIAWVRDTPRAIRGWYLPREGKRWVYTLFYDEDTLQEIDSGGRHKCAETYHWLVSPERKGMFREFHLCAPPFILLDFKEMREEYIAGNLDASFA